MRQLLDAVEFIHSKNIVHRDLKVCIAENSSPSVSYSDLVISVATLLGFKDYQWKHWLENR